MLRQVVYQGLRVEASLLPGELRYPVAGAWRAAQLGTMNGPRFNRRMIRLSAIMLALAAVALAIGPCISSARNMPRPTGLEP